MVPVFALVAIGANAVLVQESGVYLALFTCQMVFYSLASLGYVMEKKGVHQKVFYLPLYFCVVNLAALISIIKILKRENIVTWQTQR